MKKSKVQLKIVLLRFIFTYPGLIDKERRQNLLHNVSNIVNPVLNLSNVGVNTWVSCISAANSPRDDTRKDVIADQWAARITLARVFAWIGSAEHPKRKHFRKTRHFQRPFERTCQ